jgi:hypothetical protein
LNHNKDIDRLSVRVADLWWEVDFVIKRGYTIFFCKELMEEEEK